MVKKSACNAGHLGLIPRLRRSPGEGNGYPLQYSCLENSMDRGAWWATVHGVTESHATERLTLSGSLMLGPLLQSAIPQPLRVKMLKIPSLWGA